MKYLIALTVGLLMTTSAFALSIEEIICQADTGGTKRMPVSPTMTMGVPEEKIDYYGHTVSVGFNPGFFGENQQVLTLELDGYVSQVFNPGYQYYVLEAPKGVKIQCSARPQNKNQK
ncbi:MAG TPA: hypothetical protein PL182_00415 [Pseudobdellovibrionaceae bacterium]|nr:hypothetical protein [Pseudobdellovibrionaceae bacterium]